ncbi:MAG: hypothetical protein HYR88_13880 [Verrucomicrobia bacterium]|nr:hypothetical protein [Verrucomicrobiota bacterium]MBI3869915.1 hypothetical protein [Verrucomicrobiota bacterium]
MNTLHPARPPVGLAMILVMALATRDALVAALPEWSTQQSFEIVSPGLARVALTPETFGAARPDLADFRIIDPAGLELPYVIETQDPGYRTLRHIPNPASTLEEKLTRLVIPLNEPAKLQAIRLETTAQDFIKGVTFDLILRDGSVRPLARRLAMFRQRGAENLTMKLGGLPAETQSLRVTLDDSRTKPIAIVGLALLEEQTPERVLTPIAARILQRAESAGETRLTVDLGYSQLPLAGLRVETEDNVFIRRVSVLTREWVNGELRDRALGEGVIHRVALEDARKTEQLEFAFDAIAPGREVILSVSNGDSPPLGLRSVGFLHAPAHLVLPARRAGTHRLFSGYPQARRPSYDLAALQTSLRAAASARVALGAPQPNPDHRPPEGLPNIPIFGAAFEPAGWRFQRLVNVESPGVQRLELPLHALAETRSDRGDIRLVSGKQQLLYLMDQPRGFMKPMDIPLRAAEPTSKRGVVRWRLELPQPRLPIRRVRCDVGTTLFDREMRLLEQRADRGSDTGEAGLGRARWVRTPDRSSGLFELEVDSTPATRILWLETDNGENAPLEIKSVQALLPTAQLLFQTKEAGPVELRYGNAEARPPQYDLSLVAPRILAAPKHDVTVNDGDPAASLPGVPASWLFYGVLALVVLGLVFVITKLLPKPAAS